ncbi:MAG: hypothetical protein KKC68_05605 [Candidatus Thermoplasmatota archaeon]|nr:hypothetical protein [Candidatus Thermoplasmatota archaeon]MBU1941231.1 hypothetical protein [Candidatus Thermoplasmatota archaeon]
MMQKAKKTILIILILSLFIIPVSTSTSMINKDTSEEDVILNIRGGIGFVLEIINNGETPVSVNYSIEWYRFSNNNLLSWINGTMYNISNSFSNRFLYTHLRSPLMRINVTMWTSEQGIKRMGIVISIFRIFLTEERY